MGTITTEDVKRLVSVLTDDERQLLKDAVRHGCWGDGEYEFLTDSGEFETAGMMGYCTNDAKKAGHFSGRQVSAMFRSIYRKLCSGDGNRTGRVVSHCRDWWGDGSGDMMFVRHDWHEAFDKWSREREQAHE
jgi:hypothetical protein